MSTTPESPRNKWPQRPFRLDDQTWKRVRVKLVEDEETWQRIMEALTWAWLDGAIDAGTVRSHLETSPTADLWRNLLPKPKKDEE